MAVDLRDRAFLDREAALARRLNEQPAEKWATGALASWRRRSPLKERIVGTDQPGRCAD
jgi:hypothetical protein